MDLALDYEQSRKLMCNHCDVGLQKLRNCGNRFGQSKSPIKVNQTIYRVCPRSLTFNKNAEQYVVSLYFDCRENKSWPFNGSLIEQTAYCKEIFDLLDSVVGDYREAQNKKMEKDMKKHESKTKK